MSKVKNFIIDTNVILYSPKCLETFENNTIIIPDVVLEEVDSFKRNIDLNGYNARQFIRTMEEYRQKGSLVDGVELESGGKLYVRFIKDHAMESLPVGFRQPKNDNYILAVALDVKAESENETTIVSKDVNLRVKSDVIGIKSEDYYHERTGAFMEDHDDVLFVPDSYIDELYRSKELHVPNLNLNNGTEDESDFQPRINEYFLLKSEVDDKKGALVKYIDDTASPAFRLVEPAEDVCGVSPKNRKQVYLMDALLDPEIDIVFAMGIAGTGKTLLALAAGLFSTLNDNYKRLVVTRSPIPMGRDIGFLPGDITDKMDPWLKPIYDNLEFIISEMDDNKEDVKDDVVYTSSKNDITIEYLKQKKILEVEALTYIRGRTLMDTFIVIDEAQNLSPHEMKTIITRAGVNSKLIFTGDIKQIDNPYLTERDNGLINAAEKFTYAKCKHATTVYLDKGERSRLASVAADVL